MEIPTKEGMLHLQGVKFGKKSWRRVWVMLFAPSLYGIGRMELYNIREGVVGGAGPAPTKLCLKGVDKRVIRLADCLCVLPVPEEGCPRDCSAFALSTTQRTYALAAPPADDWMSIICQLAFQKNDRELALKSTGQTEVVPMSENELYSSWKSGEYQVTVQRTEAAVRCNLTGSYLLLPGTEALTLRDPQTTSLLYCWPYRLLRRFGNDKDTVSFEAGRRCDSGEGRFTFQSQDAAKIYEAIEEGIRHQSLKDPQSSVGTVPESTSASCCKLPPEDRNLAPSPMYCNTSQWMEQERCHEVEEDYVGQEVWAKPDSPAPECVYTLVSFDQRRRQPPVGKASPPSPTSSVINTPEIHVSFRQKLSKLLSKELAKTEPILPPHQEF